MSTTFTINFRREAWEQEQARARRRVVALGVWVAYFGVMALLLGLYGLNAVMFSRRVATMERQAKSLRVEAGQRVAWSFTPAEIAQIESAVENPRRWRERMGRLADLTPPTARVSSLALNPQNVTGVDSPPFIITGTLRAADAQERMRSVMNFVSTLHSDSAFSRGYRNIQLGSTSSSAASDPTAEFTIECR